VGGRLLGEVVLLKGRQLGEEGLDGEDRNDAYITRRSCSGVGNEDFM
jgi:hypothetical protein